MLLDVNSLFYSWIRGGVFLLLLYHFVFYLKHKEDVYKYYSIYLLGVFIFLIKDAFRSESMVQVYEYLMFSIQFLAFSFYIHFTRSLLDTKRDYPAWDKEASFIAKSLLVMGFVLLIVQFFFGFEFQKQVLIYGAPLLSIIFIIRLSYVKVIFSKEGIYSLMGSVILLICANITVIKMIRGEFFLINLKVHSMFYYFIGILIQTTIYAFLLADALQKIEIEKSKIEYDLLEKSSQLYKLKMTAFKNKMNPHFLFNSLNSINNFVLQNKKEEASIYITKFSSLVRKVLQTTEKVSISLAEELRISELYINIEQARLRNSFLYEINVEENIDVEELKVVPLYLQPFVENAIWHGLSLKEGEKKLTINIREKENYIFTEVIDNGIGFEESKNRKNSQNIQRKSFGIDTIKSRLNLIYTPQSNFVKISDEETIGTKVLIKFPKETS
ncbi:histidine kinase [Tenacibaculum sp. S7007]|uniref:Histidine kinase n=1 Tax=Tenacibaculum pelagium TaxID=2759527 RepID=A0A839AP50_9FLAO|nr:histidine kinase [Tenacibaculum pelagium]MBA6156875.1 histidine kinase [Tenacibaculum pelagium]